MSDLDVIIALLPRGTSGDPHSTLIAMGKISEGTAPAAEFLTPIVQMLARFTTPPVAFVGMYDDFNGTRVVRIESPMLRSLYDSVQMWTQSEWQYNPHISEQPGYTLPSPGSVVRFDRIGLWYGERRWNYRFGSGEPCAS